MYQTEQTCNSTKKDSNQDNKNLIAVAQDVKNGQHSHQNIAQWQPQFCGKMDLHIKANGQWWHEGQIIQRQALINLFSRVLWKENDTFYLKTPIEKLQIEVEDEPFFVNQIDQVLLDGKLYLQCQTTTQDVFLVDEQHPIFMRDFYGEMHPYVHVRFGMNALIQRPAFYHLIEMGELFENEQQQTVFKIKSGDLDLQFIA